MAFGVTNNEWHIELESYWYDSVAVSEVPFDTTVLKIQKSRLLEDKVYLGMIIIQFTA